MIGDGRNFYFVLEDFKGKCQAVTEMTDLDGNFESNFLTLEDLLHRGWKRIEGFDSLESAQKYAEQRNLIL